MNIERYYWHIAIILAISALFLPFWLTAVLFVASNIALNNFYPSLVILIFADIVYSYESVSIGPFYGMLSISAIVLFLLIGALKESLFVTKRL